jgi:hypothetical protein
MGADANLMNLQTALSKAEATANVPNLTPMYQATADTSKAGLAMVAMAIKGIKDKDTANKAAKDKWMELVVQSADSVHSALYTMDEPMANKVISAYEMEVARIQDEFMEFVENAGQGEEAERLIRRQQSKINGDLTRLKNQAINTRQTILDITMSTGDWENSLVAAEWMEPLNAIFSNGMKDMDNNSDVGVYFENGKMMFSHKDMAFNYEDLKKAIPFKDGTYEANLLKTASSAIINSSSAARINPEGTSFSFTSAQDQELRASLHANIKSKLEFRYASLEQKENKIPSFRDSLLNGMDIPKAIFDMMITTGEDNQQVNYGEQFLLTLDRNKDGQVNMEDQNLNTTPGMAKEFEENFEQLLNVLTNVDNPNFNLETSTDLLVGIHSEYIKNSAESSYNQIMGDRKKNTYNEQVLDNNIDKINNKETSSNLNKNEYGTLSFNSKAINEGEMSMAESLKQPNPAAAVAAFLLRNFPAKVKYQDYNITIKEGDKNILLVPQKKDGKIVQKEVDVTNKEQMEQLFRFVNETEYYDTFLHLELK